MMRTRDMAVTAAAASVIAVCAWISVPAAIPFTMQTFGVCAVSGLLGRRKGTFAVLVYIMLGAFGLPVFSGFRGGVGILLGLTGGYISGFIFCALIVGSAAQKNPGALRLYLAMALGLLVCYVLGTGWYVIVGGNVSIWAAISACVLPYLLPDALKLGLAVFLVLRLRAYIM